MHEVIPLEFIFKSVSNRSVVPLVASFRIYLLVSPLGCLKDKGDQHNQFVTLYSDKSTSAVLRVANGCVCHIYQWMNNKPEMFRISSSDAAIQLDLISRVNGISGAEDYFNNLPNNLMDKRIYEALLNAYVRARMVEKAESLSRKSRSPGVGNDAKQHRFGFIFIQYMDFVAVSSRSIEQDGKKAFERMDDIEEAELLYEEWVSIKTSYDPRIGNLLLESRISEALSCLEKALANEGSSFWRPKPVNISILYNLCERENDEKSKEALLEVLRKVGVLEDDLYMSFLPFYKGSKAENVKVSVGDDDEAADMLLNELQASI
ncbi:hypothetical protein Tco_0617058 [Tanacetum coccineum]